MTTKQLFTFLFVALLFASCNNLPAPAPTVASTPTFVPTEWPQQESVLDLAQERLGGTFDDTADIAVIVEPIPGASCNGQPCAAEVYLNVAAILQNPLLEEDVRIPKTGAKLTWGTSCQILDEVELRGYLDWREGKSPESALFIGWQEDGKDHLAALGWNWHPTEWINTGMYILDPDDFWQKIDSLCQP